MKKVMVLLLLALFALLAGCHTQAPTATGLYNDVYGGHSLLSVERSILAALYDLEWSAKKVNNQAIEATLFIQKPLLSTYKEQLLTVLIKYSNTDYSIQYLSSVNMEYDIEDNTINALYDYWVDELNQRIQDQLAVTHNVNMAPQIGVQEIPVQRTIMVVEQPGDFEAVEKTPVQVYTK